MDFYHKKILINLWLFLWEGNRMIITPLARTESKISYQDENMTWFTEYSVGQFENEKERGKFAEKYRDAMDYLTPYFSLRRRVDVLEGNETCQEWDILDFGKDMYAVALSFGDSNYYKAISLNRIHKQVVAYNKKYGDLQKELTELNDKIEPHKHQSKSNFQKEYNDLFESNLKKNGVYTAYLGKYQANTPKQNKIDIIRKTVRLQYEVELARIVTRIDVIREELSNLKVENF